MVTNHRQEYQQEIFQELRAEDELLVLARGCGLMRIVTNLLHSYDAAGNNLIIIIGADARENSWIGEALAEHAAISVASRARGLTLVNTDLMSVGTREKLYAQGGIFSITTQILVVDMLSGLLAPETITGMIVLHSDKVVATSTEAFALRLYRQKNKDGFLKAFSDAPEAFTMGFNPLATRMRNLFLRKASFWPRYQTTIQKSLQGKKKAEVIELEVPMTEAMMDIQNAIMECIEASLLELKKGTYGGNIETENWSTDRAIDKNFHRMVRAQLDQVWHRLSWKTKDIVEDLRVLQNLMDCLLTYDAVSFLKYLDTIRAAHTPPPGSTRQNASPWLFLDAAHVIFDTAKRRVYTGKIEGNSSDPGSQSLRPVLEEQPKWAQLAETLAEIDHDLYFNHQFRDDSNGTVLVMCNDHKTCLQLKQYLQGMHVKVKDEENDDEDEDAEPEPSGASMMRKRLRDYLWWKKAFAKIRESLFEENQKQIHGTAANGHGQVFSHRGKAPANKRRRVRGGGAVAATRRADGAIQVPEEKPLQVTTLLSEIRPTTEEEGQKADVITDPLENMEDQYELFDMNDLVVVHAYSGDMDEHLLEEVKPRYIIMYEPEPTFIRRVEVYRSSHNDRQVRSYYMCYGGSIEEKRFLSAVRREKDAFTKLIKEKANMSIVMTVDAHGVEDPQEQFLRTINTRIAGGGRLAATAEQPRVVVDVRELRSSLPQLIHGRNMTVVPCTLTVGDYILSPEICIERKSVSDLIGSFRSGRLFTQAEAMLQHYKSPMLLIEFDANKSFTLEPFADLSGTYASTATANAAQTDLQGKIVLLTLAFPRLKIIWSSSPYQTAEIFESLKTQQEEPDPIHAVRKGLDKDMNAEDQAFNQEPQDMLRVVPGITSKNLKNIILEAENIQEVANMSLPELEKIVGNEAARQVHRFFTRDLMEG